MRYLIILMSMLVATAAVADPYELQLERPGAGDLQSGTFLVDGRAQVEIKAVGIRYKFADEDFATAWLLRNDTGEAVWRLDAWDADPAGSSRLLRVREDRLTLEPGVYTLYQYAGDRWRAHARFRSWNTVMQDLADMLNRENPTDDAAELLDKCYVRVRVLDGPPLRTSAGLEEELYPLRLTRLLPGTSCTAGFRLRRDGVVRVRVIGERGSRDRNLYDYGWIEDARTGETRWVCAVGDAREAGGSLRNVVWNEGVQLAAGVYRAGFLCDDSHGWDDWNAPPPLDPDSWGLTLLSDGRDGLLEPLSAAETPDADACLVRWVRVGDDASLRQEFTLQDETALRVVCLGEGSRGEMFDYGVIVDLDAGREVWSLDYANARKAGGGAKNLIFDGTIRLPAGRYRAAYTTDGSHASGSWNDVPPLRAHEYGLTIRPER